MELCHVSRLNLLQLAPGAHLGRFIIYSQSAFAALNGLYGNEEAGSSSKAGYHLPRHIMTSSDVARIINSDQVQSVIRAPVTKVAQHAKKKNALKNRDVMLQLNPYFAETRKREAARVKAARGKKTKAKRSEESKAAGKKYWEMMMEEHPSSSEEESSSEEDDSNGDE